MITSGTSPIGTNSDAAVQLLSTGATFVREVNVINEGSARGWVSIDGGGSWVYLPAANGSMPGVRTFLFEASGVDVQIKRIAGGTDLSDVYADAL